MSTVHEFLKQLDLLAYYEEIGNTMHTFIMKNGSCEIRLFRLTKERYDWSWLQNFQYEGNFQKLVKSIWDCGLSAQGHALPVMITEIFDRNYSEQVSFIHIDHKPFLAIIRERG